MVILRTMLGLVGVLGLVVAMVADAAWITVFEPAIVGAMLGEIVWLMSQSARTRASSDRTESLMRFTGPIKML